MTINLELEDPVAQRLEALAKARGMTLRNLILETLQRTAESIAPTAAAALFSQETHDFGSHIESPWSLLAELESEKYIDKYSKK